METTTGCMVGELNALNFRTIPKGSFRITSPTKKSKTIEFFDDLYTYPPNFRVKLDTIDELHEDFLCHIIIVPLTIAFLLWKS